MLAVMVAYSFVRKFKKVCEIAHLKAVPGSQQNCVTALFEFLDDGLEEWNVRRVFQIDPYAFS